MAKVYIQMGVFTNKNEPSAALMFELDVMPEQLIQNSAAITANAIRLLSEFTAKQLESSLPPEELNPEKMALSILDIYHKVSAKPVLLENVMVKRGNTNDTITIVMKRDEL